MLRYSYNTSLCFGYVDAGLFDHVRSYPIPLLPRYAGMEAAWHENSQAIILRDKQAILHRIDLNEPVQIVDYPPPSAEALGGAPAIGGYGLSLSERYPLAAFMVHRSYGEGRAVVQDFGAPSGASTPVVLALFEGPALHPSDRVVAGIDHFEIPGEIFVSNVISLFDLRDDGAERRASFELDPYELFKVFGWSAGGEVIAVAQAEKMGVIPFYIFPESGQIKRSQFEYGCAISADWSPLGTMLLYSATGDAGREELGLASWDLYVETVGARPEDEFSLRNLTQTPTADEIAAAWSGDGQSIAYAQAYADEAEALWQDLFVIEPDDPASAPRRLTTTADEYETNPMWLSDSEIAYLSWARVERAWYLKRLATNEPGTTPTTVLKLPDSWYDAAAPTTEQ